MKLNVDNYNVIIKRGLLDEVSSYIEDKETLIITDDLIPKDYILKAKKHLTNVNVYTISSGESSKSIDTYTNILNYLIDSGFSKDVQLIAIGGGVVGDLTGFVASTFYRGVDFIQIPTSLLAQIDSSVGGKVAINLKRKNILGSFYDPKVVLIDPDTLDTLSQRHFNNGMAELIKYALIKDEDMFDIIMTDSYKIEDLIYRCLKIKKEIVSLDKYDQGIRHILNFGHTIAHGIEILSNFKVLHGEAVGIGMYLITQNNDIRNKIKEALVKFNLPTRFEYNKEEIYKIILNDKKRRKDEINIVLLKSIGSAYIKNIKIDELKNYL